MYCSQCKNTLYPFSRFLLHSTSANVITRIHGLKKCFFPGKLVTLSREKMGVNAHKTLEKKFVCVKSVAWCVNQVELPRIHPPIMVMRINMKTTIRVIIKIEKCMLINLIYVLRSIPIIPYIQCIMGLQNHVLQNIPPSHVESQSEPEPVPDRFSSMLIPTIDHKHRRDQQNGENIFASNLFSRKGLSRFL